MKSLLRKRSIPTVSLFLSLMAVFNSAACGEPQLETYDDLIQAVRAARAADRQIPGLHARQVQVRAAWDTGKLMDTYLLDRNARAVELINQLAADLKDDVSRLYYELQFARAYPEAPPTLDLPWGFFQYLLAVNDPREREELAERAFQEKWNWDKLRLEVKYANRDNKEFVFTATPGKTGVYRVVKAKRGPYRGKLVLDLGFAAYYKPAKLEFGEYEIVEAQCGPADFEAGPSCVLKPASGRETDLFTYHADVIDVIDGDTFQALIDLGFGITTLQAFRLWGLDAPEILTKEGREAKKFLEALLLRSPVLIRAVRSEKYGRYLADTWSLAAGNDKPEYVNQALVDRGLAISRDRD